MTKPYKIVSIGECMVEMSRLPGSENWQQGFAGDTLNTAYYLKARLGSASHVDYFTCLGDDPYSERILEFIAQNDIGTQYIRRMENKRPGIYLIHQEKGDRQFTYWRETSAARHLGDDPDRLETALKGADLVYFSGITLAILTPAKRADFLEIIKKTKAGLTCFDPNIRPVLWPDKNVLKQAIADASALCDIVLPTYDDEAILMGDKTPSQMAARYLNYGAREVVVKNGADTALAINEQTQAESAPLQVRNVIDATGAGDSFNAAYLSARLQGSDLAAALQAGHEMAGRVIRASGALIDKNVIL